jgi:hypothetical protein
MNCAKFQRFLHGKIEVCPILYDIVLHHKLFNTQPIVKELKRGIIKYQISQGKIKEIRECIHLDYSEEQRCHICTFNGGGLEIEPEITCSECEENSY